MTGNMTDKEPSILIHLRDMLALPVMVTIVIPYLLYSHKLPILKDQPVPVKIIAAIVLICGASLQLYTTYLFKRFGKGTLAPWHPTQKLVILGPYRYCRNPMITGVLMILAGEAFFFNTIPILIWTVMFFCVNTAFFIFKEEPDMLQRFGAPYEDYKKQVPRWIPKLRAYTPNP